MVNAAAAAVVEHDPADPFGLTGALCAVPSVSGDESVLADAVTNRLRGRAVGTSTPCLRTATPNPDSTATCSTVSVPPT